PAFPFAVGCIRSATCMTRGCGSLADPRYTRSCPSPASRELFFGVALAFQVAAHSKDIMAAYRHAAKALVSALAAAAIPACRRDCCGPDRGLSLFVGVRVDSAAFRSRGEFALELVPADQTGQTLVTDAWTISGTLVSPVAGGLPLTSQRVEPPDTQLTAAAIDIDDSPSMAYSDPQRVRAS